MLENEVIKCLGHDLKIKCDYCEVEMQFSVGEKEQGFKGRSMANTVRKSRTKEVRRPEVKAARLENDPRFLRRIEKARVSIRAGRGVRLEDVESK